MPKIWNATINSHKQAVHEAVLDATGALVMQRGFSGVTMSEIASTAGISRATLYKYVPDAGAALLAWHERQVERHLIQLEEVRAAAPDPYAALRDVLTTYAELQASGHGAEVPPFLHQPPNMAHAHHRLLHLVHDSIAEAAAAGAVRRDYSATELTHYCLAALSGAGPRGWAGDRRRIAMLVLDGLRAGGPTLERD